MISKHWEQIKYPKKLPEKFRKESHRKGLGITIVASVFPAANWKLKAKKAMISKI